ncbi:MAG: putative collagen-binding domain-containing protein, partial [Planctomycetota bacterium]
GVEWYFGHRFPHMDIDCEDWRTRDVMWDQTRHALEFFHKYLPFTEMESHDELTALPDDYCFARPGEIYAVYHPGGSITSLDLGDSPETFTVQWYNPRTGGALQDGAVTTITGPGRHVIGSPPDSPGKDWVALIRRK